MLRSHIGIVLSSDIDVVARISVVKMTIAWSDRQGIINNDRLLVIYKVFATAWEYVGL
jgi:hypothetical protein